MDSAQQMDIKTEQRNRPGTEINELRRRPSSSDCFVSTPRVSECEELQYEDQGPRVFRDEEAVAIGSAVLVEVSLPK